MNVATLNERLAEIHQGRKWIVAVDVAGAATELVAELQAWNAANVMVVAATEGVGPLPEVTTFYTRASGESGMAGIRAFEISIHNPSGELTAAVDKFDPAREALVVLSPPSTLRAVFGRATYGARPTTQSALEDKMIVDSIWDACNVARAPVEIVAVADAVAAAHRLAGPLGSVWVADNKEGWHGGLNYVRWVKTPEDSAEATAWFAEHADRVRVMPFLDGIPCSIHGWVTASGVAVTRPLEMIILRRTDQTGFVYGGMASFWDPPRRHRDTMRAAARAVGEHLAERVGYRGPFGIDGVLTADGFRPTELNPRMTAGHAGPADAAGFPAGAAMRAQLAGDLDLDAEWLEQVLVTAADGRRRGRAMASYPNELAPATLAIRFGSSGAEVTDAAHRQATLTTGTNPAGGVVFVRFEPERMHVGPSVAPLAVAAIDLARTTWDLQIPPVVAAPDLFASRP